MSLVALTSLMSLVGALMFFGAGYLIARWRAPAGAAALPPELREGAALADQNEVQARRAAEEALRQANKRLESAGAELRAAQEAQRAAQAKAQSAQAELSGAVSERDRLRAELSSNARATQDAAELQAARASAEAATREVETLRARLAAAEKMTAGGTKIMSTGEADRARATADLEKERSRASAAEQRAAAAEAKLSALEQRASAAESKLSAAEQRATAATTRATTAEGKLAAAETRATSAEGKVAAADARASAAEARAKGAEGKLEAAEERARSVEARTRKAEMTETAVQRAAAAEARWREVTSELELSQGRIESLEQASKRLASQLETARARTAAAEQELEQARGLRTRALTDVENENNRLKAELDRETARATQLERRLESLDSRMATQEKTAQAVGAARADEVERLRNERLELLQRAEDAEREAAGRLAPSVLEEVRRELAILREVHRAKLEELKRTELENARLQDLEARLGAVQNDLAFAKAELSRAPAPASTNGSSPDVERTAVDLVAPSSLLKGKDLDELVSRMTTNARIQSAVVCDDVGLVVAGSGAGVDVLAAMSAMLVSWAQRAREQLTLGALREISIADEHGTVISARPFAVRYSTLVFASLSKGDTREEPAVRQLFFSAPQVAL